MTTPDFSGFFLLFGRVLGPPLLLYLTSSSTLCRFPPAPLGFFFFPLPPSRPPVIVRCFCDFSCLLLAPGFFFSFFQPTHSVQSSLRLWLPQCNFGKSHDTRSIPFFFFFFYAGAAPALGALVQRSFVGGLSGSWWRRSTPSLSRDFFFLRPFVSLRSLFLFTCFCCWRLRRYCPAAPPFLAFFSNDLCFRASAKFYS